MSNTTQPKTALAKNHPIVHATLNKLYARKNVLRRETFVTAK